MWLKVFIAYASILSVDIQKVINETAKFRDCRMNEKRNEK